MEADDETVIDAEPTALEKSLKVLDGKVKCETSLTRLMNLQFTRKATIERIDCVKFAMSEKPNVWYVKLCNFDGNEGEFKGAEILCRLVAPDTFPHFPPSFYFLTENGIFRTNEDVCVSIGKYHSDQWHPVLGMSGLVLNLMSGFVGHKELGHGIGISNGVKTETIRKFSEKSKASNAENYPHIDKMIEDAYAAYSQKWPAVVSTPK
jgi:ubiquitin-protein ligase